MPGLVAHSLPSHSQQQSHVPASDSDLRPCCHHEERLAKVRNATLSEGRHKNGT